MKKILMSIFVVLTLLACGNKNDSNRVVVYSNSLSNGRGDFLKEKAKEKGFNLAFVEAGGGEIADRIIAEKNNPIADVVFGPNEMEFLKLEKENVLEPFVPKWKNDIDQNFVITKDNTYYPLVKQGTIMIYDTKAYTPEQAPKDWEDLWKKSKYHGKYEYNPNLRSATMKKLISSIATRYRDDNGEYGISEEGWKQMKAFFDNGVKAVNGEDLFSHFLTDKVNVGVMWQSGIIPREKQFGVKIQAVPNEVGVPISTEQIALIKGGNNPKKAKEFIDWFGSDEMQVMWSNQFSSVPVNTKALDKINPAYKEFEKQFKKQEIDWNYVQKNIDNWVEKIELQIMK